MFKPEIIILHHSLTDDSKTVSWNAIRQYHTNTNGWSGIGYHFGIELVGDHYEILTGRMMNEQGAHTHDHNHNTLGICFIGNYDDSDVPPEMWQLGVKFVASLCQMLNIDNRYVLGHRDFTTIKSCPGEKFSVIGFRTDVQVLMH
ncbi:hypothetical protein LCGC14_1455340 [marine sediment metagenome]|uniref:Peptidoglycan recognition protein family domain-containing protein n=1 Tax=marine sediment metagenome TaxID=412755 RepID=A0A0F9LX96_9ZZZZ